MEQEVKFTLHGKQYHLEPYRGNYKVIRDTDGWEVVTVGFNEVQGFMQGHRNSTWVRESEVVVAREAIKAYWKVHERKPAQFEIL